MSYIVADSSFISKLTSDSDRKNYLFLEDHPTLKRQWLVNSFDATYVANMQSLNSYKAINPFEFDGFAQEAKEKGYKIIFLDDPAETFKWMSDLNQKVGISINSDFKGTVDGLLPFQIQGVNFAKANSACIFNWSTGTGKFVGSCALLKWHLQQKNIDLCIYVAKKHNMINIERALQKFGDIDSTIIDGSASKRKKLYNTVRDSKNPSVIILNYEKFRNDKSYISQLVEDSRILVVWDEMPTKLKNRKTAIYKSVAECLYTTYISFTRGKKKIKTSYPKSGFERASAMYSVMLSATPIENSPEDFFNCVRLLDPDIYGSIQDFSNKFISGRDQWGNVTSWKNLDLMGAMASHIVHQVDKNDPDIAKQFPEVIEDTIYVNLHDKDQKIYDILEKEYKGIINNDPSVLDDTEILAAIGVFQMICSNSSSVMESAYQREKTLMLNEEDNSIKIKGSQVAWKLRSLVDNDDLFMDVDERGNILCSKMLALQDLLADHEGKAIIFTRMNKSLIPIIGEYLDNWGIDYVEYHGGMSSAQKQAAEDIFKSNDSCKVFLSSDAGSDSINLEVADLVIHYDLPWTWAKSIQRENRAHRITSTHKSVRFVKLIVADSIEERGMEILERKKDFHEQMMKGEIAQQSMNLRRSDLLYILTGQN